MPPRCEKIAKQVLPLLRALVAKELLNTYNLTQLETARMLGTTQAAISQYINSKRAVHSAEQFAEVMPKIQTLAKETAKRLAERATTLNETPLDLCNLCLLIFKETDETVEDFAI